MGHQGLQFHWLCELAVTLLSSFHQKDPEAVQSDELAIPFFQDGSYRCHIPCVCTSNSSVKSSGCQSHSTLRLPTCCERLLALSNPCWTLPVGCSLVHRGRIESTINLYPAKGKVMAMSAATTSLEWPD